MTQTTMTEFNIEEFKTLFRHHVGAVAIITAFDTGGTPVGFTATSVTSVSAVPSMIAFSVTSQSSSLEAMLAARYAAVHFLNTTHVDLATRFAASGADRFGDSTWSDAAGRAPILDDVATRILVELDAKLEAGSSWVFISKILEGAVESDRDALLYADRKFFSVTEIS